ncbi:MAG: DUF1719 domain-containing protein [Aliivibrio sp.]|nr:DUF1719 domain-containing protein [Aliivibrio sp.]
MNILDKVVDQINENARRTGKGSTIVYLGESEFNELQDIERGIEFKKDFYCKDSKKLGGYFCAGLKMVRVLESTYLHVI